MVGTWCKRPCKCKYHFQIRINALQCAHNTHVTRCWPKCLIKMSTQQANEWYEIRETDLESQNIAFWDVQNKATKMWRDPCEIITLHALRRKAPRIQIYSTFYSLLIFKSLAIFISLLFSFSLTYLLYSLSLFFWTIKFFSPPLVYHFSLQNQSFYHFTYTITDTRTQNISSINLFSFVSQSVKPCFFDSFHPLDYFVGLSALYYHYPLYISLDGSAYAHDRRPFLASAFLQYVCLGLCIVHHSSAWLFFNIVSFCFHILYWNQLVGDSIYVFICTIRSILGYPYFYFS